MFMWVLLYECGKEKLVLYRYRLIDNLHYKLSGPQVRYHQASHHPAAYGLQVRSCVSFANGRPDTRPPHYITRRLSMFFITRIPNILCNLQLYLPAYPEVIEQASYCSFRRVLLVLSQTCLQIEIVLYNYIR